MADNEEKLILNADSARMVKGLERAADALGKVSDLSSKTDGELGKLERNSQKLSSSLGRLAKGFRDSSSGASQAQTGLGKYGKAAQEVIGQLNKLEQAQDRISGKRLAEVELPSSIKQGRNAAGQFTQASVSNFSTSELEAIEKAYNLQRQTLESLTREELDNRRSKAELVRAAQEAQRATTVLTKAQFDQIRASRQGRLATDEQTHSLASLRYAQYDIATTYAAISAAGLLAAGTAVKIGADYESSFTNVERTSAAGGAAIQELRGDLLDLSTEIPKTFDEITSIATLGNQMGVASDGLVEFTKNVSQFATVSGLSVEESAAAFGKIGTLLNLTAEDYKRLGSAIAYAGLDSRATEAQIVAVAGEIASYTQLAGYSAEETLGLATALASLAVPPEQARSAIQSLFGAIGGAVADGGEQLDKFATVLGTTSQQASDLFRTDPSAFVTKLTESLSTLDSISLKQTLDELGLSEKRVENVMTKLSAQTDVVANDMANAAKGFADGGEMARQFELVADDLNSQFMILVNSINEFIATITGGAVPGLAGLLASVSEVINKLTELANNPAVQSITTFALVVTAAIGVFLAYRAALFLASASTLALASATSAVGGAGLLGTLRLFIAGILGYTAVTDGAITSTLTWRSALLALGRATVVLAILGVATGFITDFNGSMAITYDILRGLNDGITGTVNGIREFIAFVGSATVALYDLAEGALQTLSPLAALDDFIGTLFDGMRSTAQSNTRKMSAPLREYGYSANATSDKLKTMAAASRKASAAQKALSGSTGSGTDTMAAFNDAVGEGVEGFDGLSKGADTAAQSAENFTETVRTLKDYASDLSEVIDRAFEIRYAPTASIDAVTTAWADLREKIAAAKREAQSIKADKATKEYFLSIAEGYNDELRAGVLRGEIADLNAKLAATQDEASTSLEGNSKAAIANRATITGLIAGYGDYIESLAASGASEAELAAAVAQSRQQFIQQATQLGFNRTQVLNYARSFDDMTLAINRIPRNVTVKVDVNNPGMTAINEFEAKLTKLGNSSFSPTIGANISPGTQNAFNVMSNLAFADWVVKAQAASGRALAQSASGWAEVRRLYDAGAYPKYAEGGSIRTSGAGQFRGPGTGTSDSMMARVSNGEYINTANAVRYWGSDVFDSLNRRQMPQFAAGGPVGRAPASGGSGIMVVELSAIDRQLLAQAGNVRLSIDGRDIAGAGNSANLVAAKRGAN